MIKKIFILTFLLIFTMACSKTNLYSLKTDLLHKENVEKLINELNWENKDLKEIKIKEEKITIIFDNDKEYSQINLKSYVVNSFYLMILTNAEEISCENKIGSFFGINKKIADMFLSTQYNKSLDDIRNSEEEFHKLEKFMKNLKVDS
ncbi:hypothetical protein [Peptoniphilus grossensis]|uniref:DUF4825 domain-containing protein n=1 Tax=Peptoniphilus grossensis TaxID=1465756 RepID=A0ABU7XB59_9FIRM